MDGPRIVETDRGPTIFASGRFLYSRRDPASRPVRIARSAPSEERCLYIVPSPLLGYGLAELASRIPDSSRILALEISPDLDRLCRPRIDQSLAGHVSITWVCCSDNASLHAVFRVLEPWRFRRVRRLDLSGASAGNTAYDSLIAFLAEDLATYWRNRHALGRMGREWIRHFLTNIASLASSGPLYRPLDDLEATGLPVVAGAGPSLEGALPFLSENRENLWILAADTALGALAAAGIRPDAVVVLETQAWNMLDFHGLAGSGIPVAADLTAYPASLDFTGGPCYLFSSEFADLGFLDRAGEAGIRGCVLPPLGSVGLAAIEIALRRSIGPVLLTGLDFAYAPGKSHARGTSVHRWQLAGSSRTDPVPGWQAAMVRPRTTGRGADGRMVSTDRILEGYARLVRDRYAGSSRLFVLSPGGLDLGLPLIDVDAAAGLISGPSPSPAPGPARPSWMGPDGARRFLEREKEALEAVVAAWEAHAAGDGSAEDVLHALESPDHLYADFPDEPPLPANNESFMVRAVSRCRDLIRLMERTAV